MLINATYEMLVLYGPYAEEQQLKPSRSSSTAIKGALALAASLTRKETPVTPVQERTEEGGDGGDNEDEGEVEEEPLTDPDILVRVRRESTLKGLTRVYTHMLEQQANEQKDGPLRMEHWHALTILGFLLRSIAFARNFNLDAPLRQALACAGMAAVTGGTTSQPDLFYQEAHGLKLYLQSILRLYQAQHNPNVAASVETRENVEQIEQRLTELATFLLEEHRSLLKEANKPMLQCMDGVISTLLDGLVSIPDGQFLKYIAGFYPYLTDYIVTGSPGVRASLRNLFAVRLKGHIR